MLDKNSMYRTNPIQTPWIVHGENADRQFITPYSPCFIVAPLLGYSKIDNSYTIQGKEKCNC
jgi:hypothetical protein